MLLSSCPFLLRHGDGVQARGRSLHPSAVKRARIYDPNSTSVLRKHVWQGISHSRRQRRFNDNDHDDSDCTAPENGSYMVTVFQVTLYRMKRERERETLLVVTAVSQVLG
jgi:hypothetical protein